MTKTLQWNINGLYSHLGELQKLINDTTPDHICLQETNLKPTNKGTLTGYTTYRRDRTYEGHASGGVAILIKDTNHSNELHIQTDLEAIAVRVLSPTPITLCCIYIPPNQIPNPTDIEALINQLPNPFLLLGDFNAHNTNWGSLYTNRRGKIIEKCTQNLTLLNDGNATHFSTRNGTFSIIDLTFCNPRYTPNAIWEVLPDNYGSDHFPITITEPNTSELQNTDTTIKWNYQKANWNLFSETLQKKEIILSKHVNITTQNITQAIIHAGNLAIGTSKNHNKKKSVPWWNEECDLATRNKRNAFKTYKKHRTLENLIKFKKLNAIARRIIKVSKKTSWQKYVNSLNPTTPIKEIWTKIRKIKGKNYTSPTNVLIQNNKTIQNDIEISNTLADTFHKNFSNENYDDAFQNVKTTAEKSPIQINNENNNEINSLITKTELTSAIQELKLNGSPGPDQISNEMIKNLPDETVNKLLSLYNQIWTTHTFPNSWKESIIIPILKQNKNKTDPQSYRPITLTNTLCKLLEKIINKRILWHLETQNCLINEQAGFRKGRSTIDHLFALQTEIQTAFKNKQHVIAIFFDLEKAFDMAWNHNILQTAAEYGIQGNALYFIKNFLDKRKFKVKFNGTISEEKQQENGIPQGSVLSPTLFLLAINKATSNIRIPNKALIFADDLVLYCKGKNINSIQENLQQAITNLEEWSRNTGFRISTIKTKAMHFCKLRHPHAHPQLTLKNSLIQYTPNHKFLGLTLDTKLNWNTHIKLLAANCHKTLNVLKTIANHEWGADRNILLTMYKTLVRSKIDYGSIIYSMTNPNHLKIINTVHNTGIRIATGAFRSSPIASILAEAAEPPLEHHINQKIFSYISNILAQQKHPNRNIIAPILQPHLHILNPTQNHINQKINKYNFSFPHIEKIYTPNTPPWKISQPQCDLELTKYPKKETCNTLYKSLFHETLSKYPDYKKIYTDASKINGEIGAAYVTNEETRKFHLPSSLSTFSAEALCILKVIQHTSTTQEPNTKHLICTDSLSTIQEINKTYPTSNICTKIRENIHIAETSKHQKYTLLWTPSHQGIKGNEEADLAAKSATKEEKIKYPTPKADFINNIKQQIYAAWENEWEHTENNKLREIKNNTQKWKYNINRRKQTILTRLRIGHTRITHQHLFSKSNPPQCDTCLTTITVEHLIITCIKYTAHRQKHKIPNQLKAALENNEESIQKLFDYLEDINIANDI